jgi:hypothetical protein
MIFLIKFLQVFSKKKGARAGEEARAKVAICYFGSGNYLISAFLSSLLHKTG